MNNNKHHINLN